MPAYHYQCPGCCCTTYIDRLPEGEDYVYVLSGLCWDCEKQQRQQQEYDDDD